MDICLVVRKQNIFIFSNFIADRITKGDISLEYCPTDLMWRDFFTKPLQGAKLIEFRETIMNLKQE